MRVRALLRACCAVREAQTDGFAIEGAPARKLAALGALAALVATLVDLLASASEVPSLLASLLSTFPEESFPE